MRRGNICGRLCVDSRGTVYYAPENEAPFTWCPVGAAPPPSRWRKLLAWLGLLFALALTSCTAAQVRALAPAACGALVEVFDAGALAGLVCEAALPAVVGALAAEPRKPTRHATARPCLLVDAEVEGRPFGEKVCVASDDEHKVRAETVRRALGAAR